MSFDLRGEWLPFIVSMTQRFDTLKRQLIKDTATIKQYVDQHIAHHQTVPEAAPDWNDLKAAIDEVSALFTTIGGILASVHYVPEPAISVNWRKTFREPLFRQPRASDDT